MPRSIRFTLELSADQVLRYYQGRANQVSVLAEDGRRVEFPVQALRPFVSRQGVQGYFEILIDDNNRLLRIDRLSGS
jgi:hypothetical protein